MTDPMVDAAFVPENCEPMLVTGYCTPDSPDIADTIACPCGIGGMPDCSLGIDDPAVVRVMFAVG